MSSDFDSTVLCQKWPFLCEPLCHKDRIVVNCCQLFNMTGTTSNEDESVVLPTVIICCVI